MPYFILPKGETTTRINFAPVMLSDPDFHFYAGEWTLVRHYPNYICLSCGLSLSLGGSDPDNRAAYREAGSCYCEPCARENIDWKKRADVDSDANPPMFALFPLYSCRADAVRDLNAKTHEIVFRPSVDDLTRWREREKRRFGSGEYAHVPWHYRDQYLAVHYAHMSVDTPGYIAFTRDTEAGVLDRQTRMRPGRYLQEFYKDHFSAEEIAGYVAQCAAFESATFSLATTAQQITDIYSGSGPSSCMAVKPRAEYTWQKAFEADALPEHPCAVYAGGDLALAYVGTIGAISQRAFVWPTKRIHGRVYGTGPLAHILKRSGYTEGSFKGARLRAVAIADGYIAPYVDRFCAPGEYAADSADYEKDASGKWLVLRGDCEGDIQLDHTNGHSGDYDLVSDDNEDTFECRNCGNDYDHDDAYSHNDDMYCQSCYNDLFAMCNRCGRAVDADDVESVANGQTWCNSCIDRETVTCTRCDETWIERALSSTLQRSRRNRGVSDYCESCAGELVDCASCGSWFDPDDHETCPCGAVARCPDTAALPFTSWENVYVYGGISYRLDAETFANDPHARFELWRKYRRNTGNTEVLSSLSRGNGWATCGVYDQGDEYSGRYGKAHYIYTQLGGVYGGISYRLDAETFANGDGWATCGIYDQGSDYSGRYMPALAVCNRLREQYATTCLYQIVYIVPVATATLSEVSEHASL